MTRETPTARQHVESITTSSRAYRIRVNGTVDGARTPAKWPADCHLPWITLVTDCLTPGKLRPSNGDGATFSRSATLSAILFLRLSPALMHLRGIEEAQKGTIIDKIAFELYF